MRLSGPLTISKFAFASSFGTSLLGPASITFSSQSLLPTLGLSLTTSLKKVHFPPHHFILFCFLANLYLKLFYNFHLLACCLSSCMRRWDHEPKLCLVLCCIPKAKLKILFFKLQFPFLFLKLIIITFWPCHMACGILLPWLGIEPKSPALEAQTLNHWTSGEVPPIFNRSL